MIQGIHQWTSSIGNIAAMTTTKTAQSLRPGCSKRERQGSQVGILGPGPDGESPWDVGGLPSELDHGYGGTRYHARLVVPSPGEGLPSQDARRGVAATIAGTARTDMREPQGHHPTWRRTRHVDRVSMISNHHRGYGLSQWARKRVEEIFGWMKTVRGFRAVPV